MNPWDAAMNIEDVYDLRAGDMPLKLIRVTQMIDGRKQSSFVNRLDELDVDALFCDCEVGETYQLECIEMTEAEYAALPEFEGF